MFSPHSIAQDTGRIAHIRAVPLVDSRRMRAYSRSMGFSLYSLLDEGGSLEKAVKGCFLKNLSAKMGFMLAILEVVERKALLYGGKAIDEELLATRPYIREDGKMFYDSLGEALAELRLPKNKGKDLMISVVEEVGDDYLLL